MSETPRLLAYVDLDGVRYRVIAASIVHVSPITGEASLPRDGVVVERLGRDTMNGDRWDVVDSMWTVRDRVIAAALRGDPGVRRADTVQTHAPAALLRELADWIEAHGLTTAELFGASIGDLYHTSPDRAVQVNIAAWKRLGLPRPALAGYHSVAHDGVSVGAMWYAADLEGAA